MAPARTTRLLLIVAVIGAGVSCTSTTRSTSSAPTTTSRVTTSAPTTDPDGSSTAASSTTTPTSTWPADELHHATPTPETEAVAALMIETIPGFTLQPDSVGDTGPSDLDKAADDDGGGAAKAELKELGFVAGYQRLFLDAEKQVTIVLFLYQFDDANGAKAYATRWLTGLGDSDAQQGITVTGPDPVPGLDDASMVSTSDDAGHSMQAVILTRGTYVAYVLVQATPDFAQGAAASDPNAAELAAQQAERLT